MEVNIHFTEAKPGELEMLRLAGFRRIRMDFTWNSTELKRGIYDGKSIFTQEMENLYKLDLERRHVL